MAGQTLRPLQINEALRAIPDDYEFPDFCDLPSFKACWYVFEKLLGRVTVSEEKKTFIRNLTEEQLAYWTRKAVKDQPYLFRMAIRNPAHALGITLAWLARHQESQG